MLIPVNLPVTLHQTLAAREQDLHLTMQSDDKAIATAT